MALFTFASTCYSQERPKIGLVLSGGGAKGMAHIGVLKKLEELGIRPDYITGTSMGSVIGGLYAAGYSAAEIEKIAKRMNWDEILSNQVSIDRINFVEKPYYQRYILELGIKGLSLELPKGLIEGQRLTETLSYLTRHVHDIEDFNNLPIPFAAVAADITTGEPVVLDHGSLALSIRASMAIPSVFTPVEMEDRLLVDGGLVRNFPVPECQAMGADIIIGVFVSDELSGKDELKSAIDVLSQSAFVMSVFDSREQKKKVDILIEPDLTGFTTFSFTETEQIIERGEQAADSAEAPLKQLVEQVGSRNNGPVTRPALRDSFLISAIEIKNNATIPDKYIRGKLRIDEGEFVSIDHIEERVDILFGTRYFTKVWYELRRIGDTDELVIYVSEDQSSKFKVAFHYDNENEVGVNLNLTKRNLLPGMRALLEVDIAQNPRIDANILQFLDESQDWGVKAGLNYRNNDIPILDQFSTLQATYRNRYINPYIGLFNTARRNHGYGITIQHEFSRLKPKVASSELRSLERLAWKSWSVEAKYEKNNLNHRYFPSKGSTLAFKAKYSFSNHYDITVVDSTSSVELDLEPDQFFSLSGMHHHRWRISPKLVVGLKDYIIFNFIDRNPENPFPLPFFNDQAFIGGYRPLQGNALPFWGAEQLEFYGDNMFYNEVLLQYEVFSKVYLEVASQYVNFVYPMGLIYPDAEDSEYFLPEGKEGLWGYGAKVSYASVIGPISFGIASRQKTSDWNAFVNIGFYF